jgi:Trk K+ transport system NAD-binding subunit
LVAILRQSEVILPRGDTVLKSDDEILAIIHANHSEELAKLLGGKS